jgi:hypothetical protein
LEIVDWCSGRYFLLYMGIAHVINPDRFIKRSAVRNGGEMLTEFNRLGFQFVGVLVAAFAGFVLYMLARDIFTM